MFMQYEYIISTFGFFINIFHLIVLTRKSMRINSVNIILTGIAVNDLYALLVPGLQKLDSVWETCSLAINPNRMYFTLIGLAVRFEARRSATWLSLSMAMIRTVVASNSTSARVKTYTHPRFGLLVIALTTFISTAFTVLHVIRQQVIQNGTIILTENCDGHVEGSEMTTFTIVPTPFFAENNNFLTKLLVSLDSVISRLIPCLLFPILTCLLIRQLRKATDNRRKLSLVKPEKYAGDRASRLVTVITISFFIVEFPLGVLYLFHINLTDLALVSYIDCTMDFFFILLDVNSTSHMFICLAMSSQYRNTVRRLMGVKGNVVDGKMEKTVS